MSEGLGGIRDVIIDNKQSVYVGRFKSFEFRLQSAIATNNTVAASPRYIIEALGLTFFIAVAGGRLAVWARVFVNIRRPFRSH